MPAGKAPPNFSQAYYAVSRDKLAQLGDSLAQQAGEPAGIEVRPATDRVRVRAWDQKHPEATDEAMIALAAQKYAEHRGRGLADEDARKATAEDLTHFKYRARQALYTQGTTDWKQQVAEATRLSRLSSRSRGRPDVPGNARNSPEPPGTARDSSGPGGPAAADPPEEGPTDEY